MGENLASAEDERAEINAWRETCPVAESIELNGFRLGNYLPNKSEIVAQEVVLKIEAASKSPEPPRTISYEALQIMYG